MQCTYNASLWLVQTKEEREAAEEKARKEREAAEAKAKATADKEKAMQELANTMAKARRRSAVPAVAQPPAPWLLMSCSIRGGASSRDVGHSFAPNLQGECFVSVGSCMWHCTQREQTAQREQTFGQAIIRQSVQPAHIPALTSCPRCFRQAKEAADKEQAGEGKEDPQPFFPRAKAAEEEEDDVVDEGAKAEAEGKEVEVQEELPADAAPAGAPWLGSSDYIVIATARSRRWSCGRSYPPTPRPQVRLEFK